MADELKGQVTLITGGGSGLGAALCRTLAAAGARVVCADINLDNAEKVTSTLQEEGLDAQPIHLDVRDDAQAERVVNDIVERYGQLDTLINNAGTDITVSIEELSLDDWDRVLEVNLRAPFVLSKLALPLMKGRGGSIINISSTAAKRTWANASAYHASKWGLLGLSHALHVEARPCNVRVTAVVAGGMRTPFIMDRFPDTDPGVLQEPENVAKAVLFALTQPEGTVVPELTVLPMRETSWP